MGIDALEAEVTQIDKQGVWLLIGEKESFLSFENFPWFRSASVCAIHNVELLNERRLRWPNLDIDLAIESLEHPELCPKVPSLRGRRIVESNARRKELAEDRVCRLLRCSRLGS
jgi:hypothetical protein